MKHSRENGEKLPKTPNLNTKWPKTGWPDFFRPWCLYKKCEELFNSSKYEILAKTNDAFLRKWRKTAKKHYFGHKMLNNLDTHFFFKNPASSLFYIWNKLTSCKKAKKSYGRKYENFCCGQTDRQRDRGTEGQTEANLKDQSVGPIRKATFRCKFELKIVHRRTHTHTHRQFWGSNSTEVEN